MKMIMAVVSGDDSNAVSAALTKARFSVTKLATTGGYLKAGNTTFIIGVEDEQVDDAIQIIGNNARKRTQIIQDPSPYGTVNTMAMPLEITVGGATVFVLDVESFHKL